MPEPIVDPRAQATTDALQSFIRYSVVVVGFLVTAFGIMSKGDAVGAVTYVQENLGAVVTACFALVTLGTAGYGIYKTWKRGAQAAIPASNPEVK